MQPTISIIMPVFNGEKTLVRSLESLSAQTFRDFECIIVNDGSTDASAALIRNYVSDDPRFRVLSIPNGGVSHAKNVGLEHAQGEFLAFLDCDDRLEPLALEILHDLMTKTSADIGIAHISFEDAEGHQTAQTPAMPATGETLWHMSPTQAAQIIFRGTPFAGHLHAKLLRAEKLRSLKYREDLFIFEDMLFLLEALTLVTRVVYTPVIVHHYQVAGGALSGSLNPRKASSLLACDEMQALVQREFPAAAPEASRFALQNALWTLEELAACPTQTRMEPWAKIARKRACFEIHRAPVPSDLPLVQKGFLGAIRLGWPVFFFLYRGPYRVLKKWTGKV